jgi:hypothetical protein
MRNDKAKDMEVMLLREKCDILLNMVRDVLENEALSCKLTPCMDKDTINRMLKDQFDQRRALCAEMGIFLNNQDKAMITVVS